MPASPLWTAAVDVRHGTHTVSLAGELDMAAADDLLVLLVAELEAPGATCVVADLTEVSFLDSAALGALIGAYNHAVAEGRQLRVANPARPVRRVLDVTGVYHLLVPAQAGG